MLLRNTKKFLEQCYKTMSYKNDHYVGGKSKYHNFEQAAHLQKITREQALMGFMTKHIVSIADMVQDSPTSKFTQEQWDEKIGDTINYLCILREMVRDGSSN